MMLYKNAKVKLHYPDGDIDYFDIVADVQQVDTLTPYVLFICLDYVLRTSIGLNERKRFQMQWKETEHTPHKLLRKRTTPMAYRFWKIHSPKPNPATESGDEQQVVYASMSTQTRLDRIHVL